MTGTWRVVAGAVAVLLGVLAGSSVASAHTETDLVAAPAGAEATLSLQPTHGCGASPTVAVTVRAPVLGATAGPVPGWTATAVEDEDGTVLEWTGGVLPADQTGDFPVTFPVPDTPGVLLTLPALQQCEDGQELAWIAGDPTAEYPAPRLLVLPAGSTPASSIDEVPADAPGRDQLSEVADVDNPDQPNGAAGAGVSGQQPAGSGDAVGSDGDAADADTSGADDGGGGTDATAAGDEDAAAQTDDDDDGVSTAVMAVVIVAVVGVGGGAIGRYLLRRRSQPAR